MTPAFITWDHSHAVRRWVADRIPHADSFESASGLGAIWNGRLIAGFVFSDYDRRNRTMQISVAADHPAWARRQTIAEVLSYPFEQCGVWRLWTATPEGSPALKTNNRVGFTDEATLKDVFGPGCDAVIGRLLQPDYRRIYHGYW